MSFEGATDPASWGQAFANLNTNATIIIVSLIPWIAIMLMWRGSDKLGIVGIGTDIRGDLQYLISLLENVLGAKPRKPEPSSAGIATGAPPKSKK